MYNALASVFDDEHSGSTRLHLDASDAVNVLTHTSSMSGYALWHIFAPEDTDRIRAYLNERATTRSRRMGDPIHNQETYLTPTMLEELSDKYSIHPYVIRQYLGHAVFIPAGCPHQVRCHFDDVISCAQTTRIQVSNQANCIKVACDFISPESIAFCHQLSDEFRNQRLVRRWPPDVIPFTHMVYYTWMSSSTLSFSSDEKLSALFSHCH